MAEKNSKK